jgi:hypothetical protein
VGVRRGGAHAAAGYPVQVTGKAAVIISRERHYSSSQADFSGASITAVDVRAGNSRVFLNNC